MGYVMPSRPRSRFAPERLLLNVAGRAYADDVPAIRVTIARRGVFLLDSDNLVGGDMKRVRDGVADALGLESDRDARLGGQVEWVALDEQVDGARGDGSRFGVRIKIEPAQANPSPASTQTQVDRDTR
jgi:hypothetical protein